MSNSHASAIATAFVLLIALRANDAISADAHPLTPSNQPLLCEEHNGTKYVVPDRLYSEIINLADIPPIIIADAVKRGMTFEEMVENVKFPDENSIKGAAKKLKKIQELKLQIILNTTGAQGSPDTAANYLFTQGYVVEDSTNVPRKYWIPRIFGTESAVVIRCVAPDKRSESVKRINTFIDKHLTNFRFRQSLHELSLSNERPEDQTPDKKREALTSAKLATFSYARDYEKNSKNVAADGVVGYRIGNVTPFFGYKFLDRKGGDEDIEVISPGIQYSALVFDQKPKLGEKERIFVQLRSNLFTAFDLNNDAQRLAFDATFEPGFSIGTNLISFGAYTAPFDGPVWIRPSIRPLLEASHVFDEGSNKQFEDAEDFFGVGTEAGLKLKVPTVPVLDSWLLNFDYRVLQLVAGDDETYDFFDVSLNWTPKDVPYFGISLSYKEGQNGFTFQDQETFSVSIGARF